MWGNTMNKQLLVDVRPFDISRKKINESIKENDGRLVVKGVLQRAESKNQNGRVYPREVLLKEVAKYLENQVTERRALGELDHPESSVVNLNNASHNIIEMHWDGDDLIGTVEVLDTPKGQILEKLINRDIKLGISSRGLGSTSRTNEGYDMVEDDFSLVCYDMVSNPSTSGAYMNLQESVEYRTLISQNRIVLLDEILNDILDL